MSVKLVLGGAGCAVALVLALPASATVLYSTGFEAPDFSLGALSGQGGWAVDAVGGPDPGQVQVENTVTFDGGQAVAVPAVANPRQIAYYAYGPIAPTDPVVVSMAVDIAPGTSDPSYFAVGDVPGLNGITAGVRLFEDSLVALTPTSPVIGTYTPGTWIDFSMALDYASKTYSISINGALVASGLAFCGGAQSINTCDGNPVSGFGDVEFIPGSERSIAASDYIDDVSIAEVPEPATWALLIAGFGLAGAGLRRRRGAIA